ncbi:MAG: hypothetical protein DI556_09735 [Rhodovulum sulfidophilum]|uniref:Terminase large subunit gp17-like C-terminal domain-containing protein n=1 Tax=Rhodovulum sulfidophilum TaxID=35806 RepID=A0A2W5N8E5_RHOSU|nr:MAG: hypothetical protein DI556_09735 [Rhodovulum sulfidophilum]
MGSPRTFSTDDADLIERFCIAKAREEFWAFRRYMNPKMKVGWWQREVARELQAFAEKFFAGLRPALAIQAPPQHGKSYQILDFLAWLLGRHSVYPETCGVLAQHEGLREVYASFSDRLGVRANLRLQRIFRSERFQKIFPGFRLPGRSDPELCNRDIIEIPGTEGYFRNTTVAGSITGEGLDLGVVDDPIKGRKDASSPTIRDTAWNWFTDDLFTRFSDFGAFLMILTRWHVDDPLGRLIEAKERGEYPELTVLRYPAVAEEDEPHRQRGEALFPEHKSLEFLLRRKALMLESSWESLYQQAPFVASGDMFPIERFTIIDVMPPRSEITASVRYWDKAGTKDGEGAETSGTLMHRLRDGTFVIEHVAHGRWGALEREQKIKAWTEADGFLTRVFVEQEPGSGGKESAERTIINLAGFIVAADRPTGDKAVRAEPYAAQVQAGAVKLLRGDWNRPFLEEHEQFPNGKLKDMVDSSSGAFVKVVGDAYDLEALAS